MGAGAKAPTSAPADGVGAERDRRGEEGLSIRRQRPTDTLEPGNYQPKRH
jgi:hypothetical protein